MELLQYGKEDLKKARGCLCLTPLTRPGKRLDSQMLFSGTYEIKFNLDTLSLLYNQVI